jgi:hypothetical protein
MDSRQGGDEVKAGGEGDGLEEIISYHLTGLSMRKKIGDINSVTTP